MIEVESLTKQYGPVTAIRDVSFDVAPGQIVGFLGPNGAGKSTTMRILSCFMPATTGRARVAGYDVFRDSMEVRRRIGYLPENVPLYTDMRVAPYLDFVAEVKGVARSERKRRVADEQHRRVLAELVERELHGQHRPEGVAVRVLVRRDEKALTAADRLRGLRELSRDRSRLGRAAPGRRLSSRGRE